MICDCYYCGEIDVECTKDGGGRMACIKCDVEAERELERGER